MSQSDPFFQQWGQNWGIPLYRWDHMEANGFTWWKTRIARLTEIFQMFRLDHILGFYRIYAFPWRPERNPEFIGLSHEQAAALTGGRLPRWFLRPDDTVGKQGRQPRRWRRAPARHPRWPPTAPKSSPRISAGCPITCAPISHDLGIAGFRIPHWDCNEFGHPMPGHSFPENSFARYSTHDHDPVNGIWRGCLRAIQQHHDNPTEHSAWQVQGAHNTLRILSEFAGIPMPAHGPWPAYTEAIHLRLLKALLDSNSRYASVMVTELFGIDERINHPGTAGSHNWSLRLPWSLAQIMADPPLHETCRKFATLIAITRRTPE